MNSKKKLLASTIAFFVGGGIAQSGGAQEQGAGESDGYQLEEIVITASRRETSLNDTAISVAAVSGEEIGRRNLSEMNDYLRTIPGVNMIDLGVGRNGIIVRGISTNPQFDGGNSSASTGVYFGEVPMTGLALQGGTSDIKMIDLERVEVLRGPQGTLFGSSALGGVVRNIPNAPNLNQVEGNIKTGYSNTSGNGSDNTKFEGVVNIPLIEDVLAVRAVAYRHDTSGYIKNIAGTQLANGGEGLPGIPLQDTVAAFGGAELYRDQDDIGATEHVGGRLSVLWRPSDAIDITLQHMYQDVEQSGIPAVQLNLGGYNQAIHQVDIGGQPEVNGIEIPGLAGKKEGYADEMNLTNLTVEYDFGWANLLSSSAWIDNEGERDRTASAFFSGRLLTGALKRNSEAFFQEFRLSSQHDGPLQYIFGAYYEDIDVIQNILTVGSNDSIAFISAPPETVPILADDRVITQTEQLAFYGELSYDINEQLELTLGARRFDYERKKRSNGYSFGATRDITGETDEADTTLKVNLSYVPNDDTLLYVQWAEGFRLGATNFPVIKPLCDVDDNNILDGTSVEIKDGFGPDTTENIEFGAKLSLMDNRLQVNAAVYQVDWEGIPVFVVGGTPGDPDRSCFGGLTTNGGVAESKGFELEAIYQLTESLRVNIGGAYTDAEFSEDALGLINGGDRLVSSPEYNINFGFEYNFDLDGRPSYIRGDYAYIDEFFSKVGEAGEELGDYGQLNLSAGTAINQWSIELYGQNLTDEDAITHADVSVPDSRAYRLRPRTIGLNVAYQF